MTTAVIRRTRVSVILIGIALAGPSDRPKAQAQPGRLLANSGSAGGGLIAANVDGSNVINLTSNTFDHSVSPPAGQTSANLSAHPSVAAGKIAFQSNRDGSGFRIFIMNTDGTGPTQLTSGTGLADDTWDQFPSIAPDATRIAFISRRSGRSVSPPQNFADIFMVNVDGTGLRQVNQTQAVFNVNGGYFEYSDIVSAAWSPDGTKLAFRGRRRVLTPTGSEWKDVLGTIKPDGSSESLLAIVGDCAGGGALDWSPDGSRLVYTYGGGVQGCPSTQYNIMQVGSGFVTSLSSDQLIGGAFCCYPSNGQGTIRFSPDGTRLAYQGASGNSYTVYTIGIDGSARTMVQMSAAGYSPLWWLPGAAVPTPAKFQLLPNPASVFIGGPSVPLQPSLLDAQGNTIVKAATGWSQETGTDAFSTSQSGVITAKSSDARNIKLCASNSGLSACIQVLVNTCTYTLSPGTKSFTTAGGAATVSVAASGASCAWSASTNQTWLTVSAGSTGTGSGTVTLQTAANTGTANRSATLTVGGQTVAVNQAGSGSIGPFGSVDTPTDGATGLSGSIALTGWALDDIEVAAVQILRDPVGAEPAGTKLVGNAVLVTGARPDVAAANPTRPFNTRAGWGYLLLTNMLPNQGNGTYKLYMNAVDVEGKTTLLGTRMITCANSSATLPFGAIDTPGQGDTISGAAYLNFGWALTPLPKTIPVDGSTMSVFVDGALLGRPSYNNFRSDVSTLFPGLNNSAGPVGFLTINTTTLTNGVHTIAWSVTDNAGAAQGVGSRYFTVNNATSLVAGPPATALLGMASAGRSAAPLSVRHGFNPDSQAMAIRAGQDGIVRIVDRELGRIELQFEGSGGGDSCGLTFEGYSLVGGALHRLPIGAALDQARGVFTWHPGVGFHGAYDLVFVSTDCRGVRQSIAVNVVLKAK